VPFIVSIKKTQKREFFFHTEKKSLIFMTSKTIKVRCMTCDKGIGQFKCEGCSQIFCIKHVIEHRQTLNQQLDEIFLEHDALQQATNENKSQYKSLMTSIEQWEQKSINKIRQMAKEARQKVAQLADTHKSELRKIL
jgi:DNA anti-recombination protein RmuC